MEKKISATVYKKLGGKWKTDKVVTPADGGGWEMLATDLVNKKLVECKYIRQIKYRYYGGMAGTEEIVVYYDNDCKCKYTIWRE